ncbi:MAG: alpha amylase C-terminal domain-containing protein, partial [Kiritimatiellia bacterium]
FRLIERDMYDHMAVGHRNLRVDRGLALHKMIRLATLATAGNGYLNFMGNEFGHPEWIDFPRAGNGWSYHYARRQWHLRDDPNLVYHFLADFDRAMVELAKLAGLLEDGRLQKTLEHCDDKVIAFRRAGLLFVFNFHPHKSYSDYAIEAFAKEYRLVLDTDAAVFGGHGLVEPNQVYAAMVDRSQRALIKVYIPARTALVLREKK